MGLAKVIHSCVSWEGKGTCDDFLHGSLITRSSRRTGVLPGSSTCRTRPAEGVNDLWSVSRRAVGWKKSGYRRKQIISLNIQQLPETDPLFSGYTDRAPFALERSSAPLEIRIFRRSPELSLFPPATQPVRVGGK